MSENNEPNVRILIRDHRKLLMEKAALVKMLENIKSLKNKLKVEQIQLSSVIQKELQQSATQNSDTADINCTADINFHAQSYSEADVVEHKPQLDLSVQNWNHIYDGAAKYEIEEYDSDDSDIQVDGAAEMAEFIVPSNRY